MYGYTRNGEWYQRAELKELVIPEIEQVHILGKEKDIEMFKEFIQKKENQK